MHFLPFILTLFFGGALSDAIDVETEAIETAQDPTESATHYMERGEYYFICEHYQSASEDILDALNLFGEEGQPQRFRCFVTLGMLFANLQMDEQYFATIEHLKTELSSQHCSRCQMWHLPATQLEPKIRTVSHAFLPYAFSPIAQYSILLFFETLEHCAYRCSQSIPLWESGIAPLALKMHEWRDYEIDESEWETLTSFGPDSMDRCCTVPEGI